MWKFVLTISLNHFKKSSRTLIHRESKYYSTHGGPAYGLSYVSCPGVSPLSPLSIGQLVDSCHEKFGNSEGLFVKHQNIRKTYTQLKHEVDDFAEGLLTIGFQKGDRIGIWGPNSHEWYVTHFAAAKAGLVLVNINPAYQAREILYAINRVRMKGIVIANTFKTQNYYNTLLSVMPSIENSQPGNIQDKAAPTLSTIISMGSDSKEGTHSFGEVMWEGSRWKDRERINKMSELIQFDDICNIQFTSGTTGNPKGVTLTHHNMVNNSLLIAKRFGYTSEDRICIPVPLFHCYGSVGGMLTALHVGGTCVFPAEGFEPKLTIEVVAEEKCTALYGTPTMHCDMLNISNFTSNDLSSLRIAVTAGAICPEEIVKQMTKHYSCKVTSLYGLTETSPVIYQSLPEDSEQLRIETVGYPQEHTEVKIVDREGNIVPIGQEGEMCCRGYMTMLGYWEEPEKTKEVLKESRWFHTGDTLVMLPSGHAKVVGRLKDMIIRGGENIYPREIEDFLHSNPKIAEAHVFGIPSKRLGEEVSVWIRLKEGENLTEDHVKAYCKGEIAHFKIPKYIFFRSDFPKTVSGKIQKFKMREETLKVLGVDEVK